jgi:outer membrane protein assembly factor BamA
VLRPAPVVVAFVVVIAAIPADADAPVVAVTAPTKPIVGFKPRGHTKVTETTLERLSHFHVGDPISTDNIAELEAAFLTSELFKTVKVTLEDTPGGVLVIATLDDKMSWIAAPTVYDAPSTWSVGLGYAENDLLGQNKKMLLYGQLGNKSNLFFGTFLDPQVNGTPLQLRFDIYTYKQIRTEYLNPTTDPRSFAIARETAEIFLDAGLLVGWTFRWWLVGDFRLRGAYVAFRETHADDAARTPLPAPEVDGWDITGQARMTADYRHHLFGVTWGPYAQVVAESSVLDTYHYQDLLMRAYYSWRLFSEHQLELRANFNVGRHLPFHEELSNGGESDLRGYAVDQFRGDLQAVGRAEYSVPITKWKFFAFRALGFFDSGYIGYHFRDLSGKRDYLPTESNGAHWFRNDVGVGFRVYVKAVVLPLLGVDLGYGIEGHSPELYFELGLTDF